MKKRKVSSKTDVGWWIIADGQSWGPFEDEGIAREEALVTAEEGHSLVYLAKVEDVLTLKQSWRSE